MEIIIRHSSIYLKNVHLGKDFSNMIADLSVDRLGRVKVYVESKLSFYTDLDHLPYAILNAISERLENETKNRILMKIEVRINSKKQKMVKNSLEKF